VVCGSHISASLHCEPCAYFRSECCTDGESIAAPRVDRLLAPTINVEHEAGHDASSIFQVFGVTDGESNLAQPALVARVLPTVPLSRLDWIL